MGFNSTGQGIKGCAPWATPDAAEKKRNIQGYNLPPQEEIDACLSCEKPECTNCVGNQHKRKYYLSSKRRKYPEGYLRENILKLHEQGLKVADIAITIGITKQTVYAYLREERNKEHESD